MATLICPYQIILQCDEVIIPIEVNIKITALRNFLRWSVCCFLDWTNIRREEMKGGTCKKHSDAKVSNWLSQGKSIFRFLWVYILFDVYRPFFIGISLGFLLTPSLIFIQTVHVCRCCETPIFYAWIRYFLTTSLCLLFRFQNVPNNDLPVTSLWWYHLHKMN